MLQRISKEFLVEPTWRDASDTEFPAMTFQEAMQYQDIAQQFCIIDDKERARDLVENIMEEKPVPLRDPENGMVISNAGVLASNVHVSAATGKSELELFGLVLLSEKQNPLFHSLLPYKGAPRRLVRFPFLTVLDMERDPDNHLYHLDIIVPTLLEHEEDPIADYDEDDESQWPAYEHMGIALDEMNGEACSTYFEKLIEEAIEDKKHGTPRFE